MKCPFCAFVDTQVKDSRPSDDGLSIKRRRQCPSCLARFTTHERLELREVKIVKKNGTIRPFDISKITRSIEVACRKRPVLSDSIEKAVANVMDKINKLGDTTIESKVVGELVLRELFQIDDVAYVRYASVYKHFNTANDFGLFIASINQNLIQPKND